MKKRVPVLVLALALCLAAPAFAQNKPDRKTTCSVDPEMIPLPPCAIFSQRDRLRVIPNYVAALAFNPYGLAAAYLTGIVESSSGTWR
jgi:hypothetical protein